MKVSDAVVSVLSRAVVSGNTLKMLEQLDRPTYTAANKVLEAAGGTWNHKAKAHVFEADPADVIEQIILKGEVSAPVDFGFFPTPLPIVRRMLEIARLEPHMTVLEPSAGDGRIAHEAARFAIVDCFEIQVGKYTLLKADGVGTAGVPRRVVLGDFLTFEPQGDWQHYDRVIANPPFTRGADVRHVLHAYRFIKPGGLLVSVMSAGMLYRTDSRTAELKALVERSGGVIETLPENAFKESGTSVRTVLVTIPKD